MTPADLKDGQEVEMIAMKQRSGDMAIENFFEHCCYVFATAAWLSAGCILHRQATPDSQLPRTVEE
jgi:hypothetical protein